MVHDDVACQHCRPGMATERQEMSSVYGPAGTFEIIGFTSMVSISRSVSSLSESELRDETGEAANQSRKRNRAGGKESNRQKQGCQTVTEGQSVKAKLSSRDQFGC